MKSCENCYFKSLTDESCIIGRKYGDVCSQYVGRCFECECDEARYIHHDLMYCRDCLFKELGIEEYPAVVHYYKDGEYLGNNEDDTDLEILQNVYRTIKEIE